MKIFLFLIFLLPISCFAADEKIPEFDYQSNGKLTAPLEYFTEHYYHPTVHLGNLTVNPKKLDRFDEEQIYRTVRLALMACKEKYGQDYALSEKSDLYKYLKSLTKEQFSDFRPMMLKDALGILEKHLSRKKEPKE